MTASSAGRSHRVPASRPKPFLFTPVSVQILNPKGHPMDESNPRHDLKVSKEVNLQQQNLAAMFAADAEAAGETDKAAVLTRDADAFARWADFDGNVAPDLPRHT